MPSIDVRYIDGIFEMNYIGAIGGFEPNEGYYSVLKPSIRTPTITYKDVDYNLKRIQFIGHSRDNSGQLFLIHESNQNPSNKFCITIKIKSESAITEPTFDAFFENTDPNTNFTKGNLTLNLARLMGNFTSNSFSIKTDTGGNNFSCLVGAFRLTDRIAIKKFKYYTAGTDPTTANTIDSDDGVIKLVNDTGKKKRQICKRVNTVDNPILESSNNNLDAYKDNESLGILFIFIFIALTMGCVFLYFRGVGVSWLGIPPKHPDTDFFNNPFPAMLGGKKPRIRLGKK